MEDGLKRKLVAALPRHLLLDLIDMAMSRALQAHEVIRDNTDLKGKRARGAEGNIRFLLMEKGFQDACELHGAVALAGGLLPGTDLRFYQPFMRFAGSEGGVILSLASIPARRELPIKNQSRVSGVTLNYHLTPRFNLDDRDPKPGDIFVSFLVARDPEKAGNIIEIAVGVIDSKYESYLFYEPVDKFIANYVSDPVSESDGGSGPARPLVRLKSAPKTFKPPEEPDSADDGRLAN